MSPRPPTVPTLPRQLPPSAVAPYPGVLPPPQPPPVLAPFVPPPPAWLPPEPPYSAWRRRRRRRRRGWLSVLLVLVLAVIAAVLTRPGTTNRNPLAGCASLGPSAMSSVAGQQVADVNHTQYHVQSPQKPYSIETSPGCARFEVRPGDTFAGDKTKDGRPTRNRAELNGPRTTYGQDWWGAFDFYIPASSALPRKELAMGQFHSSRDPDDFPSRSPMLAFRLLHDGTYKITTESDPQARSTQHPDPHTRYSRPSLQRDHWYHIVFRVRFERTGNGALAVWIDGKSVYDQVIPIGFNDVKAPYWKWGIYRLYSLNTFVVYYANMDVTTTSLADQIAHPLPIPGS